VPGSEDLQELLATLSPVQVAGEFVFVSVECPPPDVDIRAMVHEDEGVSCVLERAEADRRALPYDEVLSWITLGVSSSLSAVGLTAIVSGALARFGISCNVVAGYHHDHLLVPRGRASEALAVLHALGCVGPEGPEHRALARSESEDNDSGLTRYGDAMALSVQRCVEVINESGEALASLAAGQFDTAVSSCPGWKVRDLLQHLIEVHWFWSSVVEGRLAAPPTTGRPDAVADDHLISRLLLGLHRLTDVLESADQSATVYTWAPTRHDVAFVTRHQVQEIVVHGWDAALAVGTAWPIATDVALDSVDEFLTFSVSNRDDPADPPRAALDGVLGLRCTDADASWTIEDDVVAGTVRFESGLRDDAVVLAGPAADLLLWLYAREHLPGEKDHGALVARFRHLTFTD